MKVTVINIFFIFLCFGLSTCKAEYDDVSSDEKFKPIIGMELETLRDLGVKEITTTSNNKVDFIAVTETFRVEHKGPEVISTSVLKSSSKIKIVKVLKCKNCIFSPGVDLLIEVDPKISNENYPIFLFQYGLWSEDKNTGSIVLDENTFRLLEKN